MRVVPIRIWKLVLLLLLLGAGPGSFFCRAQSVGTDLPPEPLAPCSRRTPLVISELMYHPPARPDALELEYVELFNSQPFSEDISGYRLSGNIDYTFPPNTVLAGSGFLVVAKMPSDVAAHYGIANVIGPYTNSLPNDSGTVRLRNRAGAVLLEVNYDSKTPWPRSPDGAGHSLVLARPSYGEADPRAWNASDLIGGSPGSQETPSAEPFRSLVINEFLAHTTPPQRDFIELYNRSNVSLDISGVWLSDAPATNKYRVADGTVLPAKGFISFDEVALGFALNADGESIYLVNSNQSRVLDAFSYRAQGPGISTGRFPDGAPTLRNLQSPTPGATNKPPALPPIVINEIMYHPLSRNSADEYVELFNRTANAIHLADWELSGGIDFTFPSNAILASHGYLVVARDRTNLLAHYPQLNSGNTFGNYRGTLGNAGERIALTSPEWIVSTNIDQTLSTNLNHVVVNEVVYGTGGRWGRWSDAGGSSLELIDADSDNALADNWADSDETQKAPWTFIEQTGRLDHGDGTPNALHLLLLGAGECLVDDVEVVGTTGVNLLANPSFESGLSPWVFQGNHESSALQNSGGWNNSRCLAVRTDGDGDSGANKIRVPLTANLTVGSLATLGARVRWQRGHPEILLRTAGSYLEAVGRMTVPMDLGTPGAPNSRAASNIGPAIYDVRHDPVLPAANQPTRITARLHDPDGLGPAIVRYRIDPDTNTVLTAPLVDDGTGGDALAGDGIFTATLSGRPSGTLVAFHIEAADAAASPMSRTFPSDAPARECLIRFGETEPAGAFGAYRIWFTQATSNRWTSRLKLDNHPLDATFVYGHHRVIYNAGALYAGSPYHSPRYTSPTGVACDYKLVFPDDDRFLGSDEATIVWPGLTGGDPVDQTGQREVTCYGLAGALDLPFNYQRYVHFFVNGVRRSFIMQDTQKPDGDMLQQWFPDDSNGQLFKVEIWTELDATGTATTTSIPATLGNFVTDGQKKTSRYRWNWTPRAISDTANDFTNLFALVDAVNSPAAVYTDTVTDLVDIEQWMRTFAVEHIVGNWDSYGYGNGQNMFAYKPADGRWQMMMWDADVSLGNASDGPTADLFKLTNPYFPLLNGDAATVGRMYQHPPFARAYWRAIREAVDGPLVATTLNGRLDARAAAFAANGVTATSPDAIKTFLSSRRSYCLGRLATVAANFAVTTSNPLTTTNNPVTISGTAPVEVRDILINGVPVPITWTSVTSWTARVFVRRGTNQLSVVGFDRRGHELSSMHLTNTVIYTGSDPGPANLTVLINEWMASNVSPGGFPEPVSGNYEDWFELFNPGTSAVSLAGCGLTDDLAAPFKSIVPAGYTIPAGGFLLVWADGQPLRNMSNSAQLHVNFQLARSGEAIGLFAPDGQLIDAVTFGVQTNNVSQGRFAGGGTNIAYLTMPTPDAVNAAPIRALPFAFTGIQRPANGDVVLTWPTIPGRRYRVEYKNNLNESAWMVLGEDFQATGASFSLTDRLPSAAQRFYRIRELE